MKSALNIDQIDLRAKLVKKRINIEWGEWSQVEATLNSMSEIESDGVDYSHIVFISGQDFPVVDTKLVAIYLEENVDYIELIEISDEGWRWQSRYTSFHYNGKKTKNITNFLFYLLNKIYKKLNKKRKIPHRMKPYGGICQEQLFVKS